MPPMKQGSAQMPVQPDLFDDEGVVADYTKMSDSELLDLKNDPKIGEDVRKKIEAIISERIMANTAEDRGSNFYNRGK